MKEKGRAGEAEQNKFRTVQIQESRRGAEEKSGTREGERRREKRSAAGQSWSLRRSHALHTRTAMSRPREGTARRAFEHASHTPRPHARQWCTLPSAYSTGAGGADAGIANADALDGDVERLGAGDGRADRLNARRHTAQ